MTEQMAVATKQNTPMELFRGDMKRMESEFRMVLPAQISADKFVRTTLTAVAMNKDLLQADRQSLMSSTMKAAQDGLLCDGREAALVIFSTKEKDGTYVKKVQYMPMMSGLLKKMRNSGQIASISTSVVYEKDEFAYIKGDNERIEHKPFLDGEPGALKFAYAIAVLKDGSIQREVMTRAQIEKVRAVSKTKDFGPWAQWYDAMARKTVLRQLYKYLPASAEVEQLLEHDNENYDFDMQDVTPELVSKVEGIKEKLKRNRKAPVGDGITDDAKAIQLDLDAGGVKVAEGSVLHNAAESISDSIEWQSWSKIFLAELKKCSTTKQLDELKYKHQDKILELAALAKTDEAKAESYEALEKKIEATAFNISVTAE